MQGLSAPGIHTRPKRVIVLDTETTGFQAYDRIVTLGAVRIEDDQIVMNKALYLIFDPRKDSHPEAEKVHGWDNWTTRFQHLFAELATPLHRWLSWADEIVCHNAQFDMHYVEREFRKAGSHPLGRESFCTMEEARATLWPGQSAKLDHCLQRVSLGRSAKFHGALEDALLTAALYLCMKGKPYRLPNMANLPMPKNYKVPEPRPEGELPRRTMKRAREPQEVLLSFR